MAIVTVPPLFGVPAAALELADEAADEAELEAGAEVGAGAAGEQATAIRLTIANRTNRRRTCLCGFISSSRSRAS
jgi:hypothetical protein